MPVASPIGEDFSLLPILLNGEIYRRGEPSPVLISGAGGILEHRDTETAVQEQAETLIEVQELDVSFSLQVKSHPQFERPWKMTVKQATLLNSAPWVRSLGKLGMEVRTQAWKFPTPGEILLPAKPKLFDPNEPRGTLSEDEAIFEQEEQGARSFFRVLKSVGNDYRPEPLPIEWRKV